jgi:hypothetical protein
MKGKGFYFFFLLAIFVLFGELPALADVDTAWVRRYNGPENSGDYAYTIAVDGSTNVYVTGKSYGSGTGYDYATIKYYLNGDTAWVRRYNGPGDSSDAALDIALDSSGNVYVTGSSIGSGTGYDYATIKYYPNGDTAWVRRYNRPGNHIDGASAIAADESGNVYVTGTSQVPDFVQSDYVTIKYHPNGDTAWVKTYNGPGNWADQAYAIGVDGSDNVYVTGYSGGNGTFSDYTTIKYYSNGDTAWIRRYDGPISGQDQAHAIVIDDSGNIYVTGWSEQSTGPDYNEDYATIKYDSSGNELWVQRYNGPADYSDKASAIAVDDSGNVYVTGQSYGIGTYWDYATIKYNSDGDSVWVRRHNGLGNASDYAYAIATDNLGNVYVTGESYGGWTATDYTTIKYYPNGDTAWIKTYNGPANMWDETHAIAIDDSGNVYVTGQSCQGPWPYNFDYATIKYVQTATDVSEETEGREKPSEFALFQNYPNPFNQSTKIEFTLSKPGFVSLKIYNLLGKKVRSLISEYLSSGYKHVFWDETNDLGQEVASGIYFYQLRVENPAFSGPEGFAKTKKLLLLK